MAGSWRRRQSFCLFFFSFFFPFIWLEKRVKEGGLGAVSRSVLHFHVLMNFYYIAE